MNLYLLALAVSIGGGTVIPDDSATANKKNKARIEEMEAGSQHVERRAKSKNDKKKKNIFVDGGDKKCDIEHFISMTTYDGGGTCDKTFQVTIDCNEDRTACTYEEESMNDCDLEKKSAYGTCVAFDPNDTGMLKYDEQNQQCVLGRMRGLQLKDQSDQFCTVKYNVKIVRRMEADDSSTLFLYFSDDNGKSFYNLDEPRVATKDLVERTRRRRLCGCRGHNSSCSSGSYICAKGFECTFCTNPYFCKDVRVCCPPEKIYLTLFCDVLNI